VRDQLGDGLPRPHDFLRLNGDIAGLPADAAARLVNQESSIRQAEAMLARRRQVDVGRGAAHPSAADHPHGGADEPMNRMRSCMVSPEPAIEARDPALLMEVLQMTTARAQPAAITIGRHRGARSSSVLVQVSGRNAIALVLDGVVLCVVPVGTQARLVGESV
jgi:hypothetical protein